jgi:hypothetical protein
MLTDVAGREGMTTAELITEIDRRRGGLPLPAALRAFGVFGRPRFGGAAVRRRFLHQPATTVRPHHKHLQHGFGDGAQKIVFAGLFQ